MQKGQGAVALYNINKNHQNKKMNENPQSSKRALSSLINTPFYFQYLTF